MLQKPAHIDCIRIFLQGLVQGVGFRPYVYRLANQFNLKGTVCNHNQGVEIFVEGEKSIVDLFLKELYKNLPPRSRIDQTDLEEWNFTGFKDFRIVKSINYLKEITNVSPDIAVCEECLKDREKQPHRISYPFINCTNCGPRFSIIQDIPYDRERTTMKVFQMCDTCTREFSNVSDRRYHAQPIACNLCGPRYTFQPENETISDYEEMVVKVSALLKNGDIVAVKGIGGFHLACDALSEKAVSLLREKKRREEKPFAVMFPDIESIEKYAFLRLGEKELLESWKRPIVILKQRSSLAPSVSNGLNTVGAFLPYMPFHYDIFKRFPHPLVMTSGNLSDEPICISNEHAYEKLSGITSFFVFHNREIANRVDDSVAVIINEKPRIIRRSRGYCPEPVKTNLNLEGIFAAGAELVNSFAIGKDSSAILSQYIGDLKNYDTSLFYKESVQRFNKLFKFNPKLVAHDLHPDYWSTRFAQSIDLPCIEVQHHHAHVAACMAENHLDEKVIGIAFDGTGYGTDGNSWGGEFLVADLSGFERINHFDYYRLPGGDQAVKEPWRIAVALLYKYYGADLLKMDIPFLKEVPKSKLNLVLQALEKRINAPLTSSAGRLFDAVSALTGLCLSSSFQAQAPMLLENAMDPSVDEKYPAGFSKPINLKKLFDGILEDLYNQVPVSIISARFHNTLVDLALCQVNWMAKNFNIHKIVLSGGCFQNAYLLSKLENKLLQSNYQVYSHTAIPTNDGGIALGQMVVAAKRREM